MSKYTLILTFLIIIFMLIFSHPIKSSTSIYGTILDYFTKEPIANATLVSLPEGRLLARTNSSGNFCFITNELPLSILIFHKNPAGYDYLPAKLSITTSSNLTLFLVPSSKIVLNGTLILLEASLIARSYTVNVVPLSKIPKYTLLTYGTPSEVLAFLNLSRNEILVPADTPFTLRIEVLAYGEKLPYISNILNLPMGEVLEDLVAARAITKGITVLTFPKGSYMLVDQGKTIVLKLEDIAILNYVAMCRKISGYIMRTIENLRKSGVFLNEEKIVLKEAHSYLDEAQKFGKMERYCDAFISLRKAYISIVYVLNKIIGLFQNARYLVYTMNFIVALISVIPSILLFEKRSLICITMIGFSYLFLSLVYLLNAPLRILIASSDISLMITPLIVSICLIWLIKRPSIYVALIRGDFKTRLFRHMLVIVMIMIFIAAMTSFTSISFRKTLKTQTINLSLPEGTLFVRGFESSKAFKRYLSEILEIEVEEVPLKELDVKILYILKDLGATKVLPYVMSLPSLLPLTSIFSEDSEISMPLYGFVGLDPLHDPISSRFKEMIIKGNFSLLSNRNTVALPLSLSSLLNVDIGSEVQLFGEKYRVVAILDDSFLYDIQDIDHLPISPRKIVVEKGPGGKPVYTLGPCFSSEVVVLNWHEALSLPYIAIVRIVAFSNKCEEIAKFIALNFKTSPIYRINNISRVVFYASFINLVGFENMLPLAIIVYSLIFVEALNTVYERRYEARILIATGMNPAQLALLFAIEYFFLGMFSGFLGYLLGLALFDVYNLWYTDYALPTVYSWTWPITLIIFSGISTMIASVIPALRSIRIVTPSLRIKWKFDYYDYERNEFVLKLPISVPVDKAESFMRYLSERLSSYKSQFMIFRDITISYKNDLPILYFEICRFGESPLRAVSVIESSRHNSLCTFTLRIRCTRPKPSSIRVLSFTNYFIAKRLIEPISLLRLWVIKWPSQYH